MHCGHNFRSAPDEPVGCYGHRDPAYQYRSHRELQAFLRKRICQIAETRTRYGYHRIYVLLRREGWRVNHKRVYRL